MTLARRVDGLCWADISQTLEKDGYSRLPPFLTVSQCRSLRALYSRAENFRSTIDMARYNFGQGQYRYFDYPLPPIVQTLRELLYPPLAGIANAWSSQLNSEQRWPESLAAFLERCHAEEQRRPTPLLLSYCEGDYNCLHQDLYGDVYFPLQVVFMLSNPEKDFEGGELVLVEQRPRMQSRPIVLTLAQGAAAIVPVRERPRRGARGFHRVQMRHGVSLVRRGKRMTLGIIFHDAR